MAIPDYPINDLKSFTDATSESHQVAGLYFFYQLDCLIDLAYKVAHDFYDRPELFTDLAGASATIAKLHARYGCDEGFLNKKQRQAIYAALFGTSASMDSSPEEEGNFPNLRDELIEACATFVETKFGDADSLRENVRQKHRLFKAYLTGLGGESVTWSRDGALAGLTEAVSYKILRNDGVAAVYGIATAPKEEWPYSFDSNADKLVEKISQQLMSPEKSEATDADGTHQMYKYMSREEITNRQRAAIEGARAIATVIDYDGQDDVDDIGKVITRCYTWGTALRNLKNYPRVFSKTFISRLTEKARGGIAVAQPLTGAAMPTNQLPRSKLRGINRCLCPENQRFSDLRALLRTKQASGNETRSDSRPEEDRYALIQSRGTGHLFLTARIG
jgi:hypothetical protein